MHQQQLLPCPIRALVFDLAAGNPNCQHSRPHDEVNVYLCLTCGSPVFRDDDEQDSDLTSPFCLDCFSMFQGRDSSSDDFDSCDYAFTDMEDGDDDQYDYASMTDIDYAYDDDHDNGNSNFFHTSRLAGFNTPEGPAVSLSMGLGSLDGGNATLSTA